MGGWIPGEVDDGGCRWVRLDARGWLEMIEHGPSHASGAGDGEGVYGLGAPVSLSVLVPPHHVDLVPLVRVWHNK